MHCVSRIDFVGGRGESYIVFRIVLQCCGAVALQQKPPNSKCSLYINLQK